MKFLTLLLSTLGVFAFLSPAQADMHGEKPQHPKMEKMDTDGDGVVSKDEFMAMHKNKFTKMDANDDGVLSPEELKAGHEHMKEKHEKMMKGKPGKGADEAADTDAE